MKKIVCDTNILISALIFPGGKPDQVIKLAQMGKAKLFTSPAILLEFRKVVANKFKLNEQRINELVDTIISFATIVKPKEKISVIKQKEDDNRILECAVEGNCDYIISGDERHILPLREYKGIKILRASEFLNLKAWKKK
jgi:putative PIN family toxin of toxin-antitoxin system